MAAVARLRESPEGLEIWLEQASLDRDRKHEIWIFGPGAVADNAGAAALGRRLEDRCLRRGSKLSATLAHLGQRGGALRIGSGYESRFEAQQRESLARFVKRLPDECGAFGPWWAETEPVVRHALERLPGTAVHVYFAQDWAARAPLGWSQARFDQTLAAHAQLLADPRRDRAQLVVRESHAQPFLAGIHAHTPRALAEIVAEPMAGLAAESRAQMLQIRIQGLRDRLVPEARQLHMDWNSFRTVGTRTDLLLSGPAASDGAPPAIRLAVLIGATPADIKQPLDIEAVA